MRRSPNSTPTPSPRLSVLLAGGMSRRMGAPKAAAMLGDLPLALWAARALAALTGPGIQAGGSPIADLDWPCLVDRRDDAGPGAGIETALLHAPGAVVVLCPVDMPFITVALLRRACERVEAGAIAAAPHHGDRWHPLCGACSPAFLPRLGAWLDAGRRDLQGLLDECGAYRIQAEELADCGPPDHVLANINTAEQLDRANRELAAATA
jgi:molybdopterin-guanine dinucleotide biosynthesis protein A